MNDIRFNFIISIMLIHIFIMLVTGFILFQKTEELLQSQMQRDDRIISACGFVFGDE
jgi:hypothetical protein